MTLKTNINQIPTDGLSNLRKYPDFLFQGWYVSRILILILNNHKKIIVHVPKREDLLLDNELFSKNQSNFLDYVCVIF